jgi:allantoin racemase
MKILVINPNTTLTMTRGIEASAKRVCRPDTEIIARSPAGGVASIEGNADGIAAAYHMLSLIRELTTAQSIDGIVIACFDDTGLHAARELVDCPVIGIGEAAVHAASLISARFSVLTSLQRSVTILERNAIANGWSGHNFSIHASGLPVLDLESDSAYSTLLDKARTVVARDHAECLVLGCGGMSHWTARLSQDLSVPVVDGVAAAVTLVEALVAQGLGTSKAISYAYPLIKSPTR